MIRPDKMTVKTQEALAAAQENASARSAGTIEPEHLLLSLLEQEGGFVPDLLKKIGVPLPQLRQSLEASLNRLPKVSGGQLTLSSALNRALGDRGTLVSCVSYWPWRERRGPQGTT